MIVPIAHDRMTARRLPIVTIALFFACVVAFGLSMRSPDALERFGYVPAENNLTGLVTYAFMHAGVGHLVGNVWLLLLIGFNVEDRWGRTVFLFFYLGGAVASALTHRLLDSASDIPLVGASGAIAAAMGAFLVLFGRTRIHFAYFLFVRAGTFSLPASTMLPLWVAFELLFGVAGVSDGVAHWAHVGGFAFGVAIALLLRATGIDRKLDASIDLAGDPRIDDARALAAKGRVDEARRLLQGLAKEKPDSAHVKRALEELRRPVLGPGPQN
jgi:membrane associated rhomboid family serine protease